MSHTPGPWHRHTAFPDRIIVNGSCVYQVRDMTTKEVAGDEYGQPNPADTLLIAAAPELLAALKNVARFEAVCQGMHPGVWPMIHAAIAKAEGRDE